MNRVLVTWIGYADLHAAREEPGAGLGPVAGALQERQFDALLLISDLGAQEDEAYLDWLRERGAPPLHVQRVELPDPTDFDRIHAAAVAAVAAARERWGEDAALTFHLSPGTPAMAAVWILLARTRFAADLLQSSPEAGVQAVTIPFDISAEFIPDLVRGPDREAVRLAAGLDAVPPEFAAIRHRSPAMREVIALASRMAPREVPVLIQGESGTGKELMAEAIHRASPRARGPFLEINCGAIPGGLVESELFGHEKGAFTGATAPRAGAFEAADGGTLLLDEVGETPPAVQVKLLRVLQEGKISRVGSSGNRRVDVRVVAATNRNLLHDVRDGRFREDLFHRLAVGVLALPPLRERPGDVSLLVDVFLEEINDRARRQPGAWPKRLSPGGRNLLLEHHWPGNVRELENTLVRATLWAADETIGPEHVRRAILPPTGARPPRLLDRPLGDGLDIHELIAELARHYLTRALRETDGNKTRAAELVGLPSYQTFTNWMERYGVEE